MCSVVSLISRCFAKLASGTPSSSAIAPGTVPVEPSVDSTPAITRSNPVFLIAAASTRAVTSASAPCSESSEMRTPLCAPIDSARRNASIADSGPIDTTVTSPPFASVSWRAASTPNSSPGSSTFCAPSRFRRLFASWYGLFGSGICLTKTITFIVQGFLPESQAFSESALETLRRVRKQALGREDDEDADPIGEGSGVVAEGRAHLEPCFERLQQPSRPIDDHDAVALGLV